MKKLLHVLALYIKYRLDVTYLLMQLHKRLSERNRSKGELLRIKELRRRRKGVRNRMSA